MCMESKEESFATGIAQFVYILRHLGVRVSLSETLDAFLALTHIDLLDKFQVKGTLGAVLVKNLRDRQIFNLAFDLFFTSLEEKQRRQELWQQQARENEQKIREAERRLKEGLKKSGQQWAEKVLQQLDLSPEQKEAFAQLSEEDQYHFIELFGNFEGNPVNNPAELIAATMRASLNYRRYQAMKKKDQAKGYNKYISYEPTGIEELDEIIEGVVANYLIKPADRLLHEDMKDISDEDMPAMTALLQRLSRQLATRLSRRYKLSKKHQRIDFRITIRRNLCYGGVPLILQYKSKRVQKPRLLVICDVSASMTPYARFILQFIYGLTSVVKDIESFAFAEDLERITAFLNRGDKASEIMAKVLTQSNQWGKTTNFNFALQTFLENYKNLLTLQTYVIIISDTKTLAFEKAADNLKKVRKNVKEVIWLNTLPKSEWENRASVNAFQQQAKMFECYTLAHLHKVIRGLL